MLSARIMKLPLCLVILSISVVVTTAAEPHQRSTPTMSLPARAKKFAETSQGSFKRASKEELESLRKLKLPEGVIEFYREHSPAGTISGFVNLLPVSEMVKENLGNVGPGQDVFRHGFVVFASMDGDAYCFDTVSGPDPRVVLFGHEEPLDMYPSRESLLHEKGKVVASNLVDFLTKCINETLDREPKY